MFPESFPVLTTSRITLNQFTLDDAPTVQTYISNSPDIAKNTLRIPFPYSLEDANFWINSHAEKFASASEINWAIRLKDDLTFVGSGCLVFSKPTSHSAEIGYWIARPHRNQGYVTESIKAITQFAFSRTNLHRIHADHFTTNPNSGKALSSAGFTQEGTLRDCHFKDNQFISATLYSILKTD